VRIEWLVEFDEAVVTRGWWRWKWRARVSWSSANGGRWEYTATHLGVEPHIAVRLLNAEAAVKDARLRQVRLSAWVPVNAIPAARLVKR
jgi:hypothetical protein